MSNPSAIWTSLSLPLSPVGSIPFVFTDQATIVTDVVNFFYTQAGVTLVGSLQAFQLTLFGGVRTGYTDTTTTPGSVVVNKAAGRLKLAAGQSVVTVTSNYCFASSIVEVNMESADATLTRLTVVPANGSFTITGNANATAAVTISWMVNNVY